MGQQTLLDDLRADLANGEVLVVAGTGVSIQASGKRQCASWDGLILDGIDHCVRTNLLTESAAAPLREQLEGKDSAKMIQVAETISTTLDAPTGGEFRRWLQRSVGTLPLSDRKIIDTIHALGVPISTTNYDDLLIRGRGLHAVPWTDGPAAHEIIRGHREDILHFHGYYDDPESVVLGVRSYDKLLTSRGAQAIQQAVVANRTLLFIGCGDGLSDPNFGSLLEWSAAAFGTSIYRHYCLCRNGEQETLQNRYPASKRLFFVAHGDNYEDLGPFLRKELFPAAKPRKASSANIPNPGYCIGREHEVEEVVSALLADKLQPLPILGGPGMGKTTIALTALRDKRVADRFGSRRWFIRCDGVKTRPELAAAIAQALGIPISPNVEREVFIALDVSPAALILDNAETPLDAGGAEVEDLISNLATIESLALVVTIRGYDRPHGVPWRSTIEPERLRLSVAREVFIAVAGRPSFSGDSYLDRLLGVLDGMPLAINLMARYAAAYESLEPVWSRWQAKRTAMLKDGKGADRLTNIAVSYELSIAALSPEARRLLSVLALLPDGVVHSDVASVFADPNDAAHELHRRALVFDEAKRLRMLAPLREHVAAAHPSEDADERRLIDHYLGLASSEGQKLGTAEGSAAVSRLAPEVGNVEAMLIRSGNKYEQIASAVYGWAELMRFSGLGSSRVMEEVVSQVLGTGNPKIAAQCVRSLGDIALTRSDHEQARSRYEQALPLYQKLGDVGGEANCIVSLGDIALDRSDHEQAKARYEKALHLYQKVENLRGEANCIFGLGDIALGRSNDNEARDRFEQALPLYRKLGELQGEANCIRSLGTIALQQSDQEQAHAKYDQALSIYRKTGDLLGEANCIQGLGDIARKSGRQQEAESLYLKSLALYERIQDPYSIGGTHRRLARLAADDRERNAHVTAARSALLSIKRDDLVAELDAEFGVE